jgi:hypothetical protein
VFLKAIGTPELNLNTLGATVRDEVRELARSADHEQMPAVYDRLIGSTLVASAPDKRSCGLPSALTLPVGQARLASADCHS